MRLWEFSDSACSLSVYLHHGGVAIVDRMTSLLCVISSQTCGVEGTHILGAKPCRRDKKVSDMSIVFPLILQQLVLAYNVSDYMYTSTAGMKAQLVN